MIIRRQQTSSFQLYPAEYKTLLSLWSCGLLWLCILLVRIWQTRQSHSDLEKDMDFHLKPNIETRLNVFVINRSITDWSLSLAAKNQIMFPKEKHKGLGPDQCRRKWSPELCFSSLYSWTSLRARLFALTAFSPWTLTEYARFESSSAVDVRHVCRPLMVRKVHIPLITPARPWPRHCIIVVSTKFSIPQFWYFTVGCVFILWSWWCWVDCRLIWRWGLIIVFNLDLLHFWWRYEQQVDD